MPGMADPPLPPSRGGLPNRLPACWAPVIGDDRDDHYHDVFSKATGLPSGHQGRGRATMMPDRLRAGIFLPPFHPNDEDPTLALQRDFELVEWLDQLGYDEAWIGEHHSGGYEIIASPEVFIAAAAERTRRIKLGTGVVSLPYHHPLMVAGRIVQLDHQTKG